MRLLLSYVLAFLLTASAFGVQTYAQGLDSLKRQTLSQKLDE